MNQSGAYMSDQSGLPADQLINHMLQSYSEVLAKIHTSVRSLGGRLEEIEHTRSKKVKAYKKKLARAVEKYREIEKRCMIAE